MKNTVKLLLVLLLSFIFFNGSGQEKKPVVTSRVLFVFDGSQSMLGMWGQQPKIAIAQRLLTNIVDSLSELKNVEMALRVYGHQKPVPPQDCNDTKLEVPFGRDNHRAIIDKLNSIRPKGTTPIAYSLELSANDFPKDANSRNIVVLITDGIESCDGDPCAVSLNLQRQGIILKPFIIGVGLDDNLRSIFECVGRYYNAENADQFQLVLKVVVNQALNGTTLQVNLLDAKDRPTESNVNMTFYDQLTGAVRYNFVHTINQYGNPDTLRLDPVPVYRLQVHTIPPVFVDNISLEAGKHLVVPVKVPQGELLVKMQGTQKLTTLDCIVRNPTDGKILNVQPVNQAVKYIAGKYNVELLTIPRLIFDSWEILPSRTSTIEIPQPGLVTFEGSSNAFGAVYRKVNNQLEMIYQLNMDVTTQTIAMQPGNYWVIARPKNARESVYTFEKEFTVTLGGALKVSMF
jgi:Ca-activated chloride channel family protein